MDIIIFLAILFLDVLTADAVTRKLPRYMYNRLNENYNDNSELRYSEAMNRLSQVFEIDRLPTARQHKSPPQYMQELYHAIADDDGITKTRSPFDADVVRGFPDKKAQHQMHFHFNISHIKTKEQLLEAEFHLFKLKPRPTNFYQHRRRHKRRLHLLEVRLYKVLNPSDMYSHSGSILLDVRRISAHGHGWEVFSVKNTVQQWLNGSSTNHGFLVTANSLSDRNSLNVSLVRFAQRGQHHESKQPVLVAFTEDGRNHNQRQYNDADDYVGIGTAYENQDPLRHENVYRRVYARRIKRLNEQYKNLPINPLGFDGRYSGVETDATRVQDRKPSSGVYRRKRAARKRNGGKRAMGMKHTKSVCAKHGMYVDFEEIGWSDWIISPKGYNAYHCKGDCPFPLGQTQKPTNHATVQSIVHTLKIGHDVSMPCCVPNKLYSISLLYFDDDENVILKQYDDMVAANCGCH